MIEHQPGGKKMQQDAHYFLNHVIPQQNHHYLSVTGTYLGGTVQVPGTRVPYQLVTRIMNR